MIGTIISAFILTPVIFYIWNDWSKDKFKWKSVRTLILLILTAVFTLVNYFNVNALLKMVNLILFLTIIYKSLYKTNLKNSIIGPLMIEFLFFISETLFAIVMISILKIDVENFVQNFFGNVLTNFCCSSIVFLFSKFKITHKIFYKLNDFITGFDENVVIFLVCLLAFIYTTLAMNTYNSLNPIILLVMLVIVVVTSSISLFIFFKTKNDYHKINDKYNSSLQHLKELEKALTNHRIDNHENKNHLMTIRNMTKNKKVTNFIDSILNNKLKDDKKIMTETSIIPEGGLRGLFYSKLLLMSKKKIEYELDIASSVRVVNFVNFGDNTILDICKIVGIFLDNAIEEVETIEDKYIVIEMYIEDEIFTISITNTYDNSVDKKNIYKAGVSTKGGNHGYGLSLVKKIVKYNKKLKTSHEITENEFTQILKICK